VAGKVRKCLGQKGAEMRGQKTAGPFGSERCGNAWPSTLFQPADPTAGGRPDIGSPPQFVRPETLRKHLAKALKYCNLPGLSWYQCTRHTFASQFILNCGTLELLRQLMGHSSVTTTERYAHLKPDLYREAIYTTMAVDLSAPKVVLVPIAAIGCRTGTPSADENHETRVTA